MKIDYETPIKMARKDNITGLSISDPETIKRIKSFCDKFNYSEELVKQKILDDELFACFFAKEPTRQNIHENIAADFLSKISSFTDFQQLPKNNKKRSG